MLARCVKHKIFLCKQQASNNSTKETGNAEPVRGTTLPILFLTVKINYMDLKYMKLRQQDYLTCMHVSITQQGLQESCLLFGVFFPQKQIFCINWPFGDKIKRTAVSAQCRGGQSSQAIPFLTGVPGFTACPSSGNDHLAARINILSWFT